MPFDFAFVLSYSALCRTHILNDLKIITSKVKKASNERNVCLVLHFYLVQKQTAKPVTFAVETIGAVPFLTPSSVSTSPRSESKKSMETTPHANARVAEYCMYTPIMHVTIAMHVVQVMYV